MANKFEEKKYAVAHSNWWQTFEAVFGIPFLAALVLEFVMPLSIPQTFPSFVFIPAGVALITAGVAMIILARREFRQHDQPTDPGYPTHKLVKTGVFSFSRNPLYLGGICMEVGIALIFKLGWVFIFLVPSFAACHYILIVPEEKYLAANFGAEYRRYAANVYRWLGRQKKH